jgi:group II intron reverse transcriptase/maturase
LNKVAKSRQGETNKELWKSEQFVVKESVGNATSLVAITQALKGLSRERQDRRNTCHTLRWMKKHIVKQQYKDTSTVTKLVLIAKKAKEDRKAKFTSLMYLLNETYLDDCFAQLKKRKAAGVDGRTVESYTKEEIHTAITQTVQKLKARDYQPQPVRRVSIQKDNGKTRELGIPTVIDKVIQLGMARILESIYEPIFLATSYGYRPGRDAHGCIKEVNHMLMQQKVNYIIDCDIQGFFDNIDHAIMMKCIEQKITDPQFTRLVWKILKSDVMENKTRKQTEKGTPQGGIISPILANIYLHYVLDLWMEIKEKKKLKGFAQLIRYADDFIIGVQYKEEAERLLNDIRERLKQFGLTVSEEKTKIIEFGRFAQENRERRGERKPETFTFLGFTHYCTTTRDGRFMVRVKTSRIKIKRAIASMNSFLRTNRTKPLKEMWSKLCAKLTGHYNYYGVSGNFEIINKFYHKTRYLTFKWLNRRSQKKGFSWEGFIRYLSYYPLPVPKLTYAIYNTW